MGSSVSISSFLFCTLEKDRTDEFPSGPFPSVSFVTRIVTFYGNSKPQEAVAVIGN